MTRPRLFALHGLALLVPLGFGLKYYAGPGHQLLNQSFAGAAYVLFWCLALFAIWPTRRDVRPIVLTVLIGTCLIETLQLWRHPVLQHLRATWLGKMLLGTTFDLYDYLYYLIGAAIGWALLRGLSAMEGPPHHARAN